MLAEEDIEKMKKLNAFLSQEDPRAAFRHIKKAYDEVQYALEAKLTDLKKEVKALYEEAFKVLEDEASKQKVSNGKYAEKEYTLNGIDNTSSLAALQTKKLSIDNFKSEELKKIIAAAETGSGGVKEPETYYVSRGATTISSVDELENYLEKLRKEMTQLLVDKKTIILK